jgi:transposase-like protein
MDEATKQEIIQLRRSGSTYPEISNLVGYGLKSIQKVIGENAPELAKMRFPKITIEKKKAVARDYYINGLTMKEVVEKHGISVVALQKIREQFSEQYGGKKRTAVRITFTDKQLDEIRKDYGNGMSIRQLYEKWAITGEQLFLYGIINELPKRAKLRELKAK